VDGSITSSHDAIYDRRSSWFDIIFHGLWANKNPNMRDRFHVSWLYLEVSKSATASLERVVCNFGQYGSNWMSNLIFLSELTIVIPQFPFFFRMTKPVSSTVKLVNRVTYDYVNSFNCTMWAFASKCFPIELVPCSDRWQRTGWQTIPMMPGLPVSSIPLCK